MNFQLVRASDNEIAIWNTDHGHVFIYAIEPHARELTDVHCRDIPGAEVDAASMKDEAYRFATAEARSRKLLG